MGHETCEGCAEMGGARIVEQPLGPSVSSLWATKRVRGVPRCRVMAMMMTTIIMMMMGDDDNDNDDDVF